VLFGYSVFSSTYLYTSIDRYLQISLTLDIEFSDKKGMVVPVVGMKRLSVLPWGNKTKPIFLDS